MSDILAVTYTGAVAVTPGSTPIAGTTDSPKVFAGLYTGSGGNVTVKLQDGTSVQFAGSAAGIILPVAITHVTAAAGTGLVALQAAPYSGKRRLG